MSQASQEAIARQWFRLSLRYLPAVFVGHLVWETLQLPLYTIWWERGMPEIAFAVAHCTAGDVLIGATVLAVAILMFGRRRAPNLPRVYVRVAVSAVSLGFGYTVYSEWYNTRIEGSWAYASLMPVVPPLGVGLAPVLQWIVVPAIAFWWLGPRRAALERRTSLAPPNERRLPRT